MVLNYLKITINFFLVFISTFFCGSIILLLGAVYIYLRTDAIVTEIIIPFDVGEIGRYIGHAVANLIFLAPVLYCGVAFSRFLLRAAPPRLSGRVRFGVLLLSLLPVLVCAFSTGGTLFVILTASDLLQWDRLRLINTATFGVLFLIWFGAFAFTLLKRHLKPLSFLDQPFVLFLRRFSNFSDQTVVSLILRQTPLGKPIVFLVPTRSRASDWNPFLVGFAGIKLLNPFRSVPVIVKSPETEWKQAIQFLINRAQVVIFDISEKSDAVKTEFEMISQAACWQKTIFLKNDAAKADHELEQNIRFRGSQIIYYRKSWIRGIPRMIFGYFALSLLTSVILAINIGSINNPIVIILCLLFGILFWVWLYVSFFVRPSVDRTSKISLKKILREGLESNIS